MATIVAGRDIVVESVTGGHGCSGGAGPSPGPAHTHRVLVLVLEVAALVLRRLVDAHDHRHITSLLVIFFSASPFTCSGLSLAQSWALSKEKSL